MEIKLQTPVLTARRAKPNALFHRRFVGSHIRASASKSKTFDQR